MKRLQRLLDVRGRARWLRLFVRERARWLRLFVRAGVVLALLPIVTLLVMAALEPVPAALERSRQSTSVRIYDRAGKLLRETRAVDGRKTSAVRLDELSPYVVPTLLAVEDRRFRWHPGVDPLAVVRAAFQAVRAGHIVSGGSTLTQQLARALVPRPRTLFGKFREAAVALSLEARLDKDQILTEYLNRVEFGPNLVGIDAASRHYFDKPPKMLDLAETAALVALVRGPSYYDPRKGTARLERRRNFVLRQARANGVAPDAVIERAERQPLELHTHAVSSTGQHFTLALRAGASVPELGDQPVTALHTTLDAELQRDVEALARLGEADRARVDASAAAVLVVDNASGEVLAYLGSPDYFSAENLGANDGTQALRQPGSTLKPFVYAAAMERLGWTPATLIPDLALALPTPNGPYTPANYDGLEHGPVRLRVALSNSLNLPALRAAVSVGPARVLGTLRAFGFKSLDRDAAHYGAAIALGDGEVRLSELAAAYSALARDGMYLPLRTVRRATLADGTPRELELEPSRRVLRAATARQLTSMLADDRARRPSFGTDSALSFPFQVAAKTGTSKGFRDNWAVGYTREVTVAVWVGNFDGRPMVRSSGVSGAGPLFHAVLERAMRGKTPSPLVTTHGFIERDICPLSGALPSAACPHRVRERFAPSDPIPGVCQFHERIRDPATSLERVIERYPPPYEEWARRAGRPIPPGSSPTSH